MSADERGLLGRVWARAVPIAVLLAISVLLLWKIALTSQYTWINAPDYVNQVVPWFQFQAREWHAHRIPCGTRTIGAGSRWWGRPSRGLCIHSSGFCFC